ncbi:hypothetical protein P691DRAFT_807917 [Macrolepiota fuliginosa MF-IS2]|uniref:Methyltransferase domain-containing protein n=1 Tax=Macrolepiota fuliginosa MF-IS2 TaxID=1400762 RepID=A0A9P5XJ64_9AGAR|nr:hypothetical protein P691DRAFT_807917 [Macrolepiota fuliginosa MF-IS2]
MRSGSPVSVMPMTNDLQDHLYREEFGRNLNNYSNVYQLPADEAELDRLEKQYEMLNSLIGYKYAPPMEQVLNNDDPLGVQKAVLDLGTGAGNWIVDVARDFPHCLAVAVDLTPMKAMYDSIRLRHEAIEESRRMPPNLRSEVDDINLGLEHFSGQFNVVHTRLIAIGVQDYYRLIDQISDVLRPGGLIDICEVGYVTYDRNHRPIPVTDPTPGSGPWGRPYWAHWLRAVSNVARDRHGGDITASRHLYDWIDGHRAYEDVVHHEFWLPIIPGDYARPPREAEFLNKYYRTLEYDVRSFLSAGRPMLLGAGYSEGFLNDVESDIFMEMHTAREPQYSRLECVYARKRADIPPVLYGISFP